ncbi:uncharacterized protein LOC112563194 isoform X3 [Pomacea canaliculata]|uniref:uncharacterized protein LOC112563194 isoform X3 n=1 Tax=Pomacea canaliculata TaxID=400727 RepID=UPI000D735C31|nr:uncharacterized protein LOC112563194 isoform X3 [Pomacea canaliculata]
MAPECRPPGLRAAHFKLPWSPSRLNKTVSSEDLVLLSCNEWTVDSRTTEDSEKTNQSPLSPDIWDLPGDMENMVKLTSPVSSRPSTDEDLDEFVDDTFDKMPVNTSDASENTMDDSNTTLNDLLDADRDGKGRLLSQKEASPDITVDLADFEETVSQKDADSEKVLLRNKREDHETNLQPGSSISEPDKENEKSANDTDMDFAVLELDSSHLNLDHSKQKRTLSKKGSIARRKRPSRGSFIKTATDSPEAISKDTEESASHSTESGSGVDEVFGDQQTPGDDAQTTSSPAADTQLETSKFRLSGFLIKPTLIMPGLQDLSKSKLFNQEKRKSDEDTDLHGKFHPPATLPKQTTKVQKDSQNLHVSSRYSSSESGGVGVTPCDGVGQTASNATSNGHLTSVASKKIDSCDHRRIDGASSITGGETTHLESVGSLGFDAKLGRTNSTSSMDSSYRLSRGDSTSSVDMAPEVSTPPRKGSITSSAYTPIAFRPRCSSNTVLDADNKIVETGLITSSPFVVPTVKKPLWLAEMKVRQEGSGDYSGLSKFVNTAKHRNETGNDSSSSELQISQEELSNKMMQEQEPEKPSWLKAVTEKSKLGIEKKIETDRHENGRNGEDDNLFPLPRDALKKSKKCAITNVDNKEEPKTTPQMSGPTSDSPVISTRRNQYVPSWMKTVQQQKKPTSGAFGTGVAVSSRGDVTANIPSKQLMRAYETPKWKLELAEKKKQRGATTFPGASPPSESQPEIPQWRQQLQLKKRSGPSIKEGDGSSGNVEPEWAKQAEERRARLLKSGLLDAEPQQ